MSATALDVWVPGHPIPQGSLKFFGHGKVVSDNPRLSAWRADVTRVARASWKGAGPLEGAVCVELRFTLPVPASAPKSWMLRPYWATPHRQRTGDIDKLARAILDALTAAGVYHDDAQVCELAASKVFGVDPGVHVAIRQGGLASPAKPLAPD